MTWTDPLNLSDNTIVTSDYWNKILGYNGSLQTINNQIATRGYCNIFTVQFDSTITYPATVSGTTTATSLVFDFSSPSVTATTSPNVVFSNDANGQPTIFSIVSTSNSVNVPFVNKNRTNTTQNITGIPFLVLWNFKAIPQNFLTSFVALPFRIRTTLQRKYYTYIQGDQTTTETIAAQYYYRQNFASTYSTDYYTCSTGYISHQNSDQYSITVNHSSNAIMKYSGYMTVIINPGMV